MTKIRRVIPVDAAVHVVTRGNNKQNVFRRDADKLYFYSLLLDLTQQNNILVFHYCLMDNHPHLLLWLDKESRLSKFMQQLCLSYYSYYSKRYGYCEHLWQGRFRSNIVNTDSYLLMCGKYIELNPVRSGRVATPQDYPFSSYKFYAYGKKDPLLTPSPTYLALSTSTERRRLEYVEFIVDSTIINGDKLEKFQFIGSRVFVANSEALYGVKNEVLKRGRPFKN